jgi:hypothetical protein
MNKFSLSGHPQIKSGFICEQISEIENRDKIFDNTIIADISEDDMVILVCPFPVNISWIMLELGISSSKSDFRRKVSEKSVKVGLNWDSSKVISSDIAIPVGTREISVKLKNKWLELLNANILQNSIDKTTNI